MTEQKMPTPEALSLFEACLWCSASLRTESLIHSWPPDWQRSEGGYADGHGGWIASCANCGKEMRIADPTLKDFECMTMDDAREHAAKWYEFEREGVAERDSDADS